MKLKDLLITIAIIFIAVWVIGVLLKIAGWLLNLFLVVGAILLVAGLISRFFATHRK